MGSSIPKWSIITKTKSNPPPVDTLSITLSAIDGLLIMANISTRSYRIEAVIIRSERHTSYIIII